mgnify:CR=1 FL=1
MKILLIIIFSTLCLITPLKSIKSKDQSNSEILKISVNGLVCDFCARSIEKMFKKRESVESINLNLEKMLITIKLKDSYNLNNEEITKLIENSGYEVTAINRVK